LSMPSASVSMEKLNACGDRHSSEHNEFIVLASHWKNPTKGEGLPFRRNETLKLRLAMVTQIPQPMSQRSVRRSGA